MPSNDPSQSLAFDGARLVKRLGGIWDRDGGMCHCPAHEDSSPSLSIRVGDTSLLFKCFAGCDTIEVIRAIRRLRHSIPSGGYGTGGPKADGRSDAMRARAASLWERAWPISGTPAERYLARRGLSVSLGSLRYHPRTPIGARNAVQFRPAIIAAIVEAGSVVAVQRIFLEPDTGCLARDLVKPKLTLGRPLGGAVRLSNPSSVLGLAEGVETAASASLLLGLPVWATLGNERLPRIRLPNDIERLVLLADADRAGRLAVLRARAAHARDGLSIEVLWPWGGQNDWNDVLLRPRLWEGRNGEAGCGMRPDGQAAPRTE